jgi:hypothetical protein
MNLAQTILAVRSALFVVRAAYPAWAFTQAVAERETLKQLTGRLDSASIELAKKIIKSEFQSCK